MKQSQQHITMKFNCQENMAGMSETEKGLFCSSCKKDVIDYTKISYSEIQEIRDSESEPCGIFLPEQINPSLNPIELPKARSFAFVSTILISLNFGSATAQSTIDPKVEQSEGTSNAPNLTPSEAKEKSEKGQHISMSKASAPEQSSTEKSTSTQSLKRKVKRSKKWYWSKRFPFLHRKKYHVVGRFL